MGRFSPTDCDRLATEARGVSGFSFGVCCWASVLWMVVNLRCSRSTCKHRQDSSKIQTAVYLRGLSTPVARQDRVPYCLGCARRMSWNAF